MAACGFLPPSTRLTSATMAPISGKKRKNRCPTTISGGSSRCARFGDGLSAAGSSVTGAAAAAAVAADVDSRVDLFTGLLLRLPPRLLSVCCGPLSSLPLCALPGSSNSVRLTRAASTSPSAASSSAVELRRRVFFMLLRDLGTGVAATERLLGSARFLSGSASPGLGLGVSVTPASVLTSLPSLVCFCSSSNASSRSS